MKAFIINTILCGDECRALEADPPATMKEAQATIKAVTGLERSLPQISEFLKKTRLSAAK